MALPQAGVQLVAEGSSAFNKALSDARVSVDNFAQSATNSANISNNAFAEIGKGALRELGAVVVNAAGQAAQALAGFAKDSIQVAGNFESSLQGFAAISGEALTGVGLSLDDISKKALELGKSSQYSAQEALDAMTELSKGGVDLQSIMTDATDATLNLASASGLGLAPAAEIVAKQLGVWGDTGLTATQAADRASGRVRT